jgi:hypothetical protein
MDGQWYAAVAPDVVAAISGAMDRAGSADARTDVGCNTGAIVDGDGPDGDPR